MNLYEPWRPGDLPPECLEAMLRLKKNRGDLPRDWLMCDMNSPSRNPSEFEQAGTGQYTNFNDAARYMLRQGITPPGLEKWIGLHPRMPLKQATTPAERLSAGETVEIRALTDAEFDELERVWNGQPPENRRYSAYKSNGFIQVGNGNSTLRDMRGGDDYWYAKLLSPQAPKPPEPERMQDYAIGDEVELTENLACTKHVAGDRGIVTTLAGILGSSSCLSVEYARTGETCSTWPKRLKHATQTLNDPKQPETKKEQDPMTLIKITNPILIAGIEPKNYSASERSQLIGRQEAAIKNLEALEFKTQETIDEIAEARENLKAVIAEFDKEYAARKAAAAAK